MGVPWHILKTHEADAVILCHWVTIIGTQGVVGRHLMQLPSCDSLEIQHRQSQT